MKNVMLAEPSMIVSFWLGVLPFILLPLIAVAAIVAIVFIASRLNKSKRHQPPVQPPPVVPPTKILPRPCPQCGAALQPDVPEGLCPACLLQRGIATEGGVPPGTPPFVPPTIPDLARLFPQLEILELIGKGGMGAVYKARQPSLDRFVALKILAPRSGGDLDFAERFTREARALARLSHPNIVAVYDFGEKSGHRPDATPLHYFIMEFVDGPNLRQAGKLSPREAMEIIPQICAALQFAHDEGIVHRDIKPENVLLDKKGRVKIADFGLAKILGQEQKDLRLTGVRDVMGTPHYMAPEQVERPQDVDHRADIYSLGVVFYEMLTGELPLGKFQSPSQKVQVDVRLDEVVLRSLAKEPDLRYQHVSEMGTRVTTIAHTEGQKVASGPVPQFNHASWEYKSVRTIMGLPLLHVTSGIDPQTGKVRVSRGCFAFGGIAQGVVAVGGRAYGLFAFGGIAAGLFAFGGLALGGIAMGGLALGLILAIGGGAVGTIAIGEPGLGFVRIHNIIPFLLPLWAGLLVTTLLGSILMHYWAKREAMKNVSAEKAPGAFAPPMPKPDRFWRWFAVVVLALISIPFVISILGMLAAIAIPNFVRARQHAQEIRAQNLARQSRTNQSSAATETWSPSVAANERPDLQNILSEAKTLAAQGRYEEALQRHLWYHNHALEIDPAQTGVRLSFALSDWVELGRHYPKAREALMEIRDRKTRELSEGRGFSQMFQDVAAINRELQNDDATYPLFKTLREKDPKLAQQCYFYVEDLLASKGDYQLCLDYMGGAAARFNLIRRSYEMQLDSQKRMAEMLQKTADRMAEINRKNGRTNAWSPPDTSEMIRRSAIDRFVGQTRQLIEILVETGNQADAGAIRDQALAMLDDPRLKSAVSDAENRIHDLSARNQPSSKPFVFELHQSKDGNVWMTSPDESEPPMITNRPGSNNAVTTNRNLEANSTARMPMPPPPTLILPPTIPLPGGKFLRTLRFPDGFDRPPTLSPTNTPNPNPAPADTSAAERARDLATRFTAAKAITAFPERDSAMAAIARDAARALNSDLAREALGKMTAFPVRDAAALQAARELVKGGQRAEAIAIAKTITSFSERDAALKELAR